MSRKYLLRFILLFDLFRQRKGKGREGKKKREREREKERRSHASRLSRCIFSVKKQRKDRERVVRLKTEGIEMGFKSLFSIIAPTSFRLEIKKRTFSPRIDSNSFSHLFLGENYMCAKCASDSQMQLEEGKGRREEGEEANSFCSLIVKDLPTTERRKAVLA